MLKKIRIKIFVLQSFKQKKQGLEIHFKFTYNSFMEWTAKIIEIVSIPKHCALNII